MNVGLERQAFENGFLDLPFHMKSNIIHYLSDFESIVTVDNILAVYDRHLQHRWRECLILVARLPMSAFFSSVEYKYDEELLWATRVGLLTAQVSIKIDKNLRESKIEYNTVKHTVLSYICSKSGLLVVVEAFMNRHDAAENIDRAEDKLGIFPLMWAADRGNIEAVKILIANNAKIDALDKNGDTALITVSRKNDIKIATLLIEAGANIEVKNKVNGNTALLMAGLNRHKDMMIFLIENEANYNTINKFGTSSIMFAIDNGHVDVVQLMIDKGADINHRSKYGKNPLLLACNNENMLNLLIENGADLEAKNADGYTVFIECITNFKHSAIKLLLSKGVDINPKNNGGHAALRLAIIKGRTKTMSLLLNRSCGAGILDPLYGGKHLLSAVKTGNVQVVKTLIDAGADIHMKTDQGESMYDVAVSRGHPAVASFLRLAAL
jgi:ankyrin repeat protein